jgi:hypothetical protein
MRTILLYIKVVGRELAGLIRDLPDLLAQRIQEFCDREAAMDKLQAICNDRGAEYVYLEATQGDLELAIELAMAGIDPCLLAEMNDLNHDAGTTWTRAELQMLIRLSATAARSTA